MDSNGTPKSVAEWGPFLLDSRVGVDYRYNPVFPRAMPGSGLSYPSSGIEEDFPLLANNRRASLEFAAGDNSCMVINKRNRSKAGATIPFVD